MAQYFNEVVAAAAYATNGQYKFGFTPRGYRIVLLTDGPLQFSFDGVTDHGQLGPSDTRPMEIQVDNGGGASSGVWVKGTSNEQVQIYAWD